MGGVRSNINHECTLSGMETDWFYWSACSQQDEKLPSVPLWHSQIHTWSTVPNFGLCTAIKAGQYESHQGKVGEAETTPSAWECGA